MTRRTATLGRLPFTIVNGRGVPVGRVRQGVGMRPDLRRDPDALDRVAVRLDDVVADLRAAAAGPTGDHGTDALRIADELESLAGTARYCAGAARTAEEMAAAAFRAVPGHPAGPVPAGPPTAGTGPDPR